MLTDKNGTCIVLAQASGDMSQDTRQYTGTAVLGISLEVRLQEFLPPRQHNLRMANYYFREVFSLSP
jgi:hypothetical protein